MFGVDYPEWTTGAPPTAIMLGLLTVLQLTADALDKTFADVYVAITIKK